MTSISSLLSDARSFVGLSLEELRRIIGEGAEAVSGDEYGKMEDLTSIEGQPAFPGTIYLENGTVALVRIGREALREYRTEELQAQHGTNMLRLRSRAGKLANLWVSAEQGIAYSAQGETIHFIEVFRPRTQQEYQAQIYWDPGPFIR